MFRQRLINKETLLGTLITLPSPEIAEILSAPQYNLDWLWIDLEHTAIDLLMAQRIMQATRRDCAKVVRVPVNDPIWIKRILDMGANGIMAPQINTKKDAEQLVSSCKYPPFGERGLGIARAQAYGLDMPGYIDHANDNIAVIAQIEHINGVNNIDEIIKVPGIDAILIGPFDLSASLGMPGQIDAPEVQEAIERIIVVCKENNKAIGFFAPKAEGAQKLIDKGVSLIVMSNDTLLLTSAMTAEINQLAAKKAGV